jgi:hypothetical protein
MPFDPTGFREAADESKSGDAPPDAIYEAELVGSKIATRQSDDAQWVVFTWKVVSGAHRDSSWESMHTLERAAAVTRAGGRADPQGRRAHGRERHPVRRAVGARLHAAVARGRPRERAQEGRH